MQYQLWRWRLERAQGPHIGALRAPFLQRLDVVFVRTIERRLHCNENRNAKFSLTPYSSGTVTFTKLCLSHLSSTQDQYDQFLLSEAPEGTHVDILEDAHVRPEHNNIITVKLPHILSEKEPPALWLISVPKGCPTALSQVRWI